MFFLPLSDDNPVTRAALVTWFLICACALAFLWQHSLAPSVGREAEISLGMVPAVLLGHARLSPHLALIPAWASIVTSMFLHGGWIHLLGNMLFLWIFGDNVEEAMGSGRFLLFYLIAGFAAALAQAFAAPDSEIPMIGASGAIAGILGAYFVLFPRSNVRVLVVILFYIRIVSVPAVIVIGIWFGLQVIGAERAGSGAGGVAFAAHVGGFLCGLVLLPLFKRRTVPMFGAPRSRPFQVARAGIGRKGRVPTVVPRDPWRG